MAPRRRPAKEAGPGPLRRAIRAALALAGLGVLLAAGTLFWLWPRCSGSDCPSVEALRDYTPPQASRVFDRAGNLLAHLAPERRIVVPLEAMPGRLTGAFLAVEDRRFFRHDGIDVVRVGGALARNVQRRRWDQGFSTITMQLTRNVFPAHLSREKTVRRKLWEVVLAREIEQAFAKDEILEMYLNQIYLGEGYYGVEAAAQGYFGRAARDLTLAESATLAALPRSPNHYNPRRNPVGAVQRRNLVLRLMADAGVVPEAEAASAREARLVLAPPLEARGEAPYFLAAVRRELRERFGPEAESAGLRVHTTLDLELQRAAEAAMRAQLEAVEAGRLGRYGGPACGDGAVVEDPERCLQGMFVAMQPRNGDVLALVGGRDFRLSQFDRATQARRQAGSAFKPFVFAAALQAGLPITTHLVGPGAADYEGGYRPADHVSDTTFLDMREALRLSSNRAAVALGERIGVGRVVQVSRALGFSTPIHDYPSTVLGASDVIPIEMVAAFTAFANGGTAVMPRFIRRVENGSGQLLWEVPLRQRHALPASVAYLTLSMMEDVVNSGTGTGVRAAGLPYSVPAAGKTGTTNEAADVWFVGVTPELAAGVWFGFDRPRRIMVGASGGRLAAPVWGRVMADYYRGRAHPAAWPVPADLIRVQIDPATGGRATANCPPEGLVSEWFIPGTEPREGCSLHPDGGFDGWFRRAVRGLGEIFGGSSP
jgi:penicillin-binding protein 1A